MSEPDPNGPAIRRFRDPNYRPLCANLNEVRTNIDRLDRAIVGLLAERAGYVKDATRFKRDTAEVAAPARQAAVFMRVRAMAVELGAPPDVVETAYRALVAGFVAGEAQLFAQTDAISPEK